MKVGLVGAGGMGRRHLSALARDPRVEIAGVVETDEVAAWSAASDFGGHPCRTVADLTELGVDAAYVALPNAYHGAVTREALDRGLHVFSEKPMATSLHEARQVAACVRRSGRVYQMGSTGASPPHTATSIKRPPQGSLRCLQTLRSPTATC